MTELRRIPSAVLVGFAAVLIAREPSLFTDPRFWAEEAGHYYGRFLNESALSALTYIHVGSYQLLANLMVLLATKVPMWAAPVVTTYLSFGVLLVVAYQLGVFAREYRVGPTATVLLSVAFAFQWGMYEVALSATNVQWVAGVAMLVLMALPSSWLDRNLKAAAGWAVVCGLSGIPAALCAPGFLLKALLARSRSATLIAIALFCCAAVQAACVLLAGTEGRDLDKSWAILLMPTLMQTAIEPFTGPEPLFLVGTYISAALPKVGMLLIATAAAGVGVIAASAVLASAAVKDRVVWVIVFAWLYVSLVQTVGAFHPPQLLTAAGARYYLFGATALLLLLVIGTTHSDRALRSLAHGALGLACVAGVSQRIMGDWTPAMVSGPSWKHQVHACRQGERCVLHAWPNDGTVYLLIENGTVRSSYFPDRLPALPPAAR